MPEERRSGRLPAAWALTILLPPLVWALACPGDGCPNLLELGMGIQPILGLIWLEALLAVSSEWLRGRPALAFSLGSLGVFSTFTSPYLAARVAMKDDNGKALSYSESSVNAVYPDMSGHFYDLWYYEGEYGGWWDAFYPVDGSDYYKVNKIYDWEFYVVRG